MRNLHLVSRRHTLYSHLGIPAHYFFLRFCHTPLRPVLALNRSPGLTSAGGFSGARRLEMSSCEERPQRISDPLCLGLGRARSRRTPTAERTQEESFEYRGPSTPRSPRRPRRSG